MDVHLDDAPTLGIPFTGLMQVAIFDQEQRCHVLRSSIEGRTMFLEGKLTSHDTVVLIVAAEVISTAKIPTIRAVETTKIFPKPNICLQNLSQVVEVCSGMGCLGVGLAAAGFDVKVRSDVNDRMLHLASKLGDGVTLKGDVCTDQLLADLSQSFSGAQTLAAGVACQPYSRLGDQRHQHDPRSQTLPGVLRLGFLGVYGMIVLECVQEAFSCAWVQQLLQRFSTQTGYKVTQGVLSLQHLWPARRTRWWCILTHPTLGQVPWEPLPRLNPVPIVADLLDKFQICDEETYNQLLLDLYELGRFDAQGFEHNEVPWQGQMATSLHSCGNQLMGCPCGCRQYAFTDQRLQQGGLHGLLIKLEGTSRCGQKIYPNHRHISPDELALLNGMFPGIQWGVHARMALCALGQMASPIHSCWVGSLMMKHLHQHFGLPKAFTPKEELCQLICRLLQARDSVFGLQHGPNCKAFQSRIERELLDPPCSGKPEFFTDGHTHAMPFPTAAPTAEVSSPTVPTERPGTRDEPTGKGVPHLQPPTIESKPGWPPAPQCTVEVEENTANHVNMPVPADLHPPISASEPRWPPVPPCTVEPAGNTANQIKGHPAPVHSQLFGSASEPGRPPEPPCTVGQAGISMNMMPDRANACIGSSMLDHDQETPPLTQRVGEATTASTAGGSIAEQHKESEPGRSHALARPVELHDPGMLATPGQHNASFTAHAQGTLQKSNASFLGQVSATDAKTDNRDLSQPPYTTYPKDADHTAHANSTESQSQPSMHEGYISRTRSLALPGMLATPGEHNASLTKATLANADQIKPADHTNESITKFTFTYPGMLATPGQHNASPALPGDVAQQKAILAPEAPARGTQHMPTGDTSGSTNQPGMLATPGQHNASPTLPCEAAHQKAILAHGAATGSAHSQTEGHNNEPTNKPGMLATPGQHNASQRHPGSICHQSLQVSHDPHSTGGTHHHPPALTTGGVMGFETCKGKSQTAEDQDLQRKRTKPCHQPPQSGIAKEGDQPDLIAAADQHHEGQQQANTHPDEQQTDANTADQQIQVWIIHEQESAPKAVTVQRGTTAGQITQAEAKLNAMIQPIAVRSWVNSVVPLYEPVHDKQFIKLCQNMDMPRCPFLSGKCTAPEIEFPCPRIHALWAQQAFVAIDEMDFYLQVAARDAKVIAFPAKHFPSEAAVTTESQEWLGPAIQALDQHTTWVSAAIVNHHWIPIMFSRTHDTIIVTTTPAGSILLDQIAHEAHLQGFALEVTQKILPQSFAADCGFQSFAWINHGQTRPRCTRSPHSRKSGRLEVFVCSIFASSQPIPGDHPRSTTWRHSP